MNIVELSTGKAIPVIIIPVETADFKILTSKRYYFNWAEEKNQEVYKLVREDINDILGLISIERISAEWRIHIRLLTVSKENAGKGKEFVNIAGNLIAHAAKIAIAEFGEFGCVSLRPKSQIIQHYIDRYKMRITGMTLSLEVPEILDLIKRYDEDK